MRSSSSPTGPPACSAVSPAASTRASNGAANATGVDVAGRDVHIPQSDFDVHVAIWAVAALLVGLAMWSWLSLLIANGLMFSGSVALELAQATYTRSRNVELGDPAANAVGVVVGTLAVAAFAVLWRLLMPRRPGSEPRARGASRGVAPWCELV